jgi:Cu/Ag efflux protein CusF
MAAMKTTFLLTIISALLLSTGVASAATRQYEGTVVSVNRDAKTFRLHDAERGTIRIKVRTSTRFEDVSFAGLKKGMKRVEATVKRADGRWVAISVERSGGGGHHGADD